MTHDMSRRDALTAMTASAAGFAGLGSIASAATGAAGANAIVDLGYDTGTGEYTLPDLPYPYDALEPHIDARTMTVHHDKHHAGYVGGLNTRSRRSTTSGGATATRGRSSIGSAN